MKRQEREITDSKIIDSILRTSHICRVAFNGDKYPYIVPMNYGYNGSSIFFHCALEGKKLELIQKNNNVCFEIELDHEIIKGDISCQWTTKYRSVIGYGSIKVLSDSKQKIKALDIIMQQHGKMENSYIERAVQKMNALELSIEHLTAKQGGFWE